MTTTPINHSVYRHIDRLHRKYIDFLQELIKYRSTAGNEKEIQDRICKQFRTIGLVVDQFDIPEDQLSIDPAFVRTGMNYSGRPINVAVLRGTRHGRSLALNAHIDIAPVEDQESWVHPPFEGVIEGNKIYGRGVVDDKAGVSVMLLVAEALIASGVEIAADVLFQTVIEDEISGNGSLACMRKGYTSDGAIVLDGTWPERAVVSHLGQQWVQLKIPGEAKAACNNSRASNPVQFVPPLLTVLRDLERELNRGVSWFGIENPCYVSIGSLSAGIWAGSTPENISLNLQIGFCSPWTFSEVREIFQDNISNCDQLPDNIEVQFLGLSTNPVDGDPENELCILLKRAVRENFDKELEVVPVTGHADIRHFTNAKGQSVPVCLYGPGGGGNPHIANEYYHLDHMPVVAKNLVHAILNWWGNVSHSPG